MRPASEAEVAFLAGFFCGEGTVYAHANAKGRVYVTLSMGNTDLGVLEQYREVFGGGVYGPLDPKHHSLSVKPLWMWKLSRREWVLDALAAMRPWLTATKREQADSAVEREAANPPRRTRWTDMTPEQRKAEHAAGRLGKGYRNQVSSHAHCRASAGSSPVTG